MMRVEKSVLIGYSAAQMFRLVERVEDYPQFLPWCGASQVLTRDEHGMQASITIQFKAVHQTFTTQNIHQYPQRIDMKLVNGPFRSLAGCWQFIPLAEHACKIHFVLDYEFSSRILEQVIGPVFGAIAKGLVDSFVQRAEVVYGT